jgi:hypothetical protein
MAESRHMSHDWQPGKPHFEIWFIGDLLRSREDGKDYILSGFSDGPTSGVYVDAPHLGPGRWSAHPSHYDNLSEEIRTATTTPTRTK